MPTDPTPTPTPREVDTQVCDDCGRVYQFSPILTREQWLMVAPSGYGMLCGYCVGERAARLPHALWMDTRLVFSTDAALAATGDAPLAEVRLDKLRHIFETHRDIHPLNSTEQLVAVFALEVLTAYTALAAQLAALRAERDDARRWQQVWRERLAKYGVHQKGCRYDQNPGSPYTYCTCGLERNADDDVRALLERGESPPEPDALILCLLCARNKPWGTWHPYGVGVCKDCRDAAAAVLATPARPTDTGRDG